MSIFHTIKKAIVKKAIKRLLHKFAERHEAKRVLAAASTDKLGKIFAPGSGRVIMMADIPDDVFGEGNIGDGCGILFEESTLVSPVTGAVSAIMSGQHVLGITSDDGIEVVLHVGFDGTKVALESFSRLVEQDQRVTVGRSGYIDRTRGRLRLSGYTSHREYRRLRLHERGCAGQRLRGGGDSRNGAAEPSKRVEIGVRRMLLNDRAASRVRTGKLIYYAK